MGNYVNKKYYRIICLILFSLLMLYTNKVDAKNLMSNLNGYIELTDDYSIIRIYLPSGKKEIIFKKNPFFYYDFDASPDGNRRVLAPDPLSKEPDRLLLYDTTSKEFTLIVRKSCARGPSYSPGNNKIAYISGERDAKNDKIVPDWNVYLVSPDGSYDKKASDLFVSRYKPSWFPDGKKLSVSTNNYKIFIIDLESNINEEIVNFGESPAVSHDGNKIAYLSTDANSNVQKILIDKNNMSRQEYNEIITGKKIKPKEWKELENYRLKQAIYIYDVNTKKSKKVLSVGWVEQPVLWSPDDKYILFSDRSDLFGREIYVLDIKTGKKEKITYQTGQVWVWR
jgi:Tol biopolymer transport system component